VKKHLPAIRTDSYRKSVVIDEVACTIEILEMSGLDPIEGLRNQALSDADAFILMYNTYNRSSFTNISKIRSQIAGLKRNLPHPIVIVGLDHGEKPKLAEREVSRREASLLAHALFCSVVEASAPSYLTIEKAIFDLVRTVRRQKNLPPVCCEPCQCEHGARI
jgi:hypothetical protein